MALEPIGSAAAGVGNQEARPRFVYCEDRDGNPGGTLTDPGVLLAARRIPAASPRHPRGIYVAAGFHLIASAPHRDFGPKMVGEDWVIDLTAS